MNKRQVKSRITQLFRRHFGTPKARLNSLLPKSITAGKLYEAYILGVVARDLTTKEGLRLRLVNGRKIALKSSPGPINTGYPHIRVFRHNTHVANLWTDVEFTSLSFSLAGGGRHARPNHGQYHELDIVMTPALASGRPAAEEIWLGVECKNTGYSKSLLREILGVRRELSYFSGPVPSNFNNWPRAHVPARPPSCLLVYSTDSQVTVYSSPGETFGIEFLHVPLP
jgi:hypothetical protein